MAIRRIEVGVATPVTTTFYTPNTETAVDADTPSTGVSCTVNHLNGNVIQASTVATHGATGKYSITIPAQASPATLILIWTGLFAASTRTVTETVYVVGRFVVDLFEIRALDGLADATAYPTSVLIDKRDAAEDLFEQVTGPWCPRYSLDTLDGDSTYRRAYMPTESSWVYEPNLSRRLMLRNKKPRSLISVNISKSPGHTVTDAATSSGSANVTSASGAFLVDDVGRLIVGPGVPAGTTVLTYTSATAVTLSATASASATVSLTLTGAPDTSLGQYMLYESGEVERALTAPGWPRGVRNVTIEYLYGRDDAPAHLRAAFLTYVRHLIVGTTGRISDRATSIQTAEGGSIQLGQADAWDHPTGIADVDAVLMRYDERDFAIA